MSPRNITWSELCYAVFFITVWFINPFSGGFVSSFLPTRWWWRMRRRRRRRRRRRQRWTRSKYTIIAVAGRVLQSRFYANESTWPTWCGCDTNQTHNIILVWWFCAGPFFCSVHSGDPPSPASSTSSHSPAATAALTRNNPYFASLLAATVRKSITINPRFGSGFCHFTPHNLILLYYG